MSGGYPFDLDPFQVRALDALDRGTSVLVAAPTGSGKTVVAEHAIGLALAAGKRAFYTTPIKALSNQKYGDLARRHGIDRVGLLTGDNAINPDASVVVMTTEVLRNMIYAGNPLRDLEYVVLDEVHYLQDAYRGPVWEEVIIHTPAHVKLVCLSATASNADELADWITLVRGPTEVVVELERPVRLEHLFMAADRSSERLHLVPTLVDGRPNPEGTRFDAVLPGRRGRGGRPRPRFGVPSRLDVVDELARRDLLPVLYFIFSRAACDEATSTCLNAGVRLTTPEERRRVRAVIDRHVDGLRAEDLAVLGFDRWSAALEAGIAAHHAGMVPPFKEAVEECFVQGLVKVVFATETLALGINMPARTAVIEKLSKFTGERHEFLTAGEYTQLTGRAGRRGIDDLGHAVVLWSPFVGFEEVATLAASRSFFLRSAFRPTYNMAANLVRRYDEEESYRLLNRSFAQYQADRSVVRMEHRLAERRADLDRLRQASPVDVDQLQAYVALRRAAQAAGTPDQAARRAIEMALARLVPGTVIRVSGQAGVVLSVAQRRNSVVAKAVLTSRRVVTLTASDFLGPPARLGTIEMPQPYQPHHRGFQDEVIRRLAGARIVEEGRDGNGGAGRGRSGHDPRHGAGRGGAHDRRPGGGRAGRGHGDDPARAELTLAEAEAAARQADLEAHPLHVHPERDALARAAVRLERAQTEVDALTRQIDTVGDTVARRFRRLLELLRDWDYVAEWGLTERGMVLARCYHECDLLVAESLAVGLLDGLDPPTTAALASCFTYEHRARTVPPQAWFPDAEARARWREMQQLGERLNRDEGLARLPPTRLPDATFAGVAYAWAAGGALDEVLEDEELSGGDFVRNIKQLIDLLRQIGEIAPEPATARNARAAADALFRGVVAASSGIDEARLTAEDESRVHLSAADGAPAGSSAGARPDRAGPDAGRSARRTVDGAAEDDRDHEEVDGGGRGDGDADTVAGP